MRHGLFSICHQQMNCEKKTSRRIVIRVHERWHEDYEKIVQDWFQYCGYGTASELYSWIDHHYVHLLGVNNRRFHLIIDMEKVGLQNPHIEEIPYEIYRLKKPNESTS